jgi:hypothetical protein
VTRPSLQSADLPQLLREGWVKSGADTGSIFDAAPQVAGKALREVAGSLPSVQFTVLSGHSHHEARVQILPNLEAIVQRAQYHKPTARVLRLEGGLLFDKGSLDAL